MSLSIFLPTRKGSQRVSHKNTRTFAGIEGGLLELKLRQLQGVKEVSEIVLSTNDEESIRIGERHRDQLPGLKIIPRPDELSDESTNLSDLIEYVGEIVASEHVLWTHVTSPFCDAQIYQKAIKEYSRLNPQEFDSLIGVQAFQNFLWDPTERKIVNKTGSRQWPNSQDLKLLFEINSAVFMAPRKVYRESRNRIGSSPYLFEMNKIQSLDIDIEEDFKITEALYASLYR